MIFQHVFFFKATARQKKGSKVLGYVPLSGLNGPLVVVQWWGVEALGFGLVMFSTVPTMIGAGPKGDLKFPQHKNQRLMK